MLSVIQQYRKNPQAIRWEQAAYTSLSSLQANSAYLRRSQAAELFASGQWRTSASVAPHKWALRFGTLAPHICHVHWEHAFKGVGNHPIHLQWLSLMRVRVRDLDRGYKNRLSKSVESNFSRIIEQLDMQDPLARAMCEVGWDGATQVKTWRKAFAQDSMHDTMGALMDVRGPENLSLDIYLSIRKKVLHQLEAGNQPSYNLPDLFAE